MNKEEVKKLTYKQKIDLIRNGNLWCWKTFWIGIVSRLQKIIFTREFAVFVIYTIAMWQFDLFKKDNGLIFYTIISGLFILVESLRILIEHKTTMNITADFGAKILKEIKQVKGGEL